MDIELKRRWVDALRSGEIEQGEGAFLLRGKFCALGVLLDLDGFPREMFEIHSEDELLEESVAVPGYARCEEILGKETTFTVWDMNDSGSTFPELADWIERNV